LGNKHSVSQYFRPIPCSAHNKAADALRLAGGWCWFDRVEVLERGRSLGQVGLQDVPQGVLENLTRLHVPVSGVPMDKPAIMGILNVTPDSFSDGGQFCTRDAGLVQANRMITAGADILDIGGESTRPGADFVDPAQEVERTAPVISAIRETSEIPISIDTRKGAVADAAIAAGATMVNDVSGLSFDPQLSDIISKNDVPACIMHAQGDPKTMQESPEYNDVILDVFDYLAGRIDIAIAAGIDRENIIVDPGIGFGKTSDHNLALLRSLSVFHGLGCPILLGASRKRFIGTIGNAQDPADRVAGSVAVTLAGLAQGVQIHRVHDVFENRQAVSLWAAATGMGQ
jgi:dihydropteroate synthase